MSDHLSEDVLSLRELSVEFPAPLGRASAAELKRLRREVQIVLPDPCGSLDPRWTVERVIAIARGLASSPRLVIADEPVSALEDAGPGRRVACFRPGELASTAATISGDAP